MELIRLKDVLKEIIGSNLWRAHITESLEKSERDTIGNE